MGLTNFSTQLLERHIDAVPVSKIWQRKTVTELGSQNLYHSDYPSAPYAKMWYEERGFLYECIDLNGENNALRYDLSQPFAPPDDKRGLITDFGTSEHVGNGKHEPKAFYNCWLNKHNLCAVGGLIVSENPKTGNWPKHGFNYYTEEFYHGLAKANGYEILEIGEHPAMWNTTDGWNIYCVLKKTSDQPFMKFTEFKKLDFRTA
jgi:hypothetical protein